MGRRLEVQGETADNSALRNETPVASVLRHFDRSGDGEDLFFMLGAEFSGIRIAPGNR